jgi:hypothetical protein
MEIPMSAILSDAENKQAATHEPPSDGRKTQRVMTRTVLKENLNSQ